jgi:hypothetical protein
VSTSAFKEFCGGRASGSRRGNLREPVILVVCDIDVISISVNVSRIALVAIKGCRTDGRVGGIGPMRMIAVVFLFDSRIDFNPTTVGFAIGVIPYATSICTKSFLSGVVSGKFLTFDFETT